MRLCTVLSLEEASLTCLNGEHCQGRRIKPIGITPFFNSRLLTDLTTDFKLTRFGLSEAVPPSYSKLAMFTTVAFPLYAAHLTDPLPV